SVVLTATLPAGVFYSGSSSDACSPGSSQVVCYLESLAAGQSTGLEIQVSVGAAISGPITTTFTVAAAEPDAVPVNNTLQVTTLVEAAISGLMVTNDSPTILGQTTTLTATVLTGTNTVFTWDFGDGSVITAFVTGNSSASLATGAVAVDTPQTSVVTHTYAVPGVYTATVTAYNSVSVFTGTTVVYVDEAILGLTLVSNSPSQLYQTTTFTASVGAGSNIIYTWDFGDGYLITGGPVVTHTYAASGFYTVTVTAANSVSVAMTYTVVQVIQKWVIYLPIIYQVQEELSPTHLGVNRMRVISATIKMKEASAKTMALARGAYLWAQWLRQEGAFLLPPAGSSRSEVPGPGAANLITGRMARGPGRL
ncbi:MAG: PKD domain-containing protein, partial [Chloroflexi bacterium]|nr:PKD domain-containing protein [Chloroflexota bacterium]